MTFKTLDEIEILLGNLGFSRYNPSPFDHNDVIVCYQKRFDDAYGKKYFIDVKVWDWTWTDRVNYNYTIEFSTQMYDKETHDAINLDFLGWNYQNVVDWIEKGFAAGLYDYYEEWD